MKGAGSLREPRERKHRAQKSAAFRPIFGISEIGDFRRVRRILILRDPAGSLILRDTSDVRSEEERSEAWDRSDPGAFRAVLAVTES